MNGFEQLLASTPPRPNKQMEGKTNATVYHPWDERRKLSAKVERTRTIRAHHTTTTTTK